MPKEPALEEDHLAKTVAALERVAGRRPAGTRSSNTARWVSDRVVTAEEVVAREPI